MLSIVSDFLVSCFESTEADFGQVDLAYGGKTIKGTLSEITDEKELMPGGFERNLRCNFCTTGERFSSIWPDAQTAIGKQVNVDSKTYRVERVDSDPAICNIGLISTLQAK